MKFDIYFSYLDTHATDFEFLVQMLILPYIVKQSEYTFMNNMYIKPLSFNVSTLFVHHLQCLHKHF